MQISTTFLLSATDAWASGSEGNVNNTNFNIPYVLHFNGTTWTLVTTPNLGGEGSQLGDITALTASDVEDGSTANGNGGGCSPP